MKERLDIRLADTNIEILTDCEYLFNMCKNYISEFDQADFTVETDDSDLVFEKALYKERNQKPASDNKLRQGVFESLAVYRKISEQLIEKDTVLFQGSAVAVDGVCYLFCADSGTGKSTHTRFWKNHFKDRAVMINDDKPLIQIKNDGIKVFGTPWSGKHHLDTNTSAPLKAVCFLERGKENQIMPVQKEEALSSLLRYCYRSSNPVHLQASIRLLLRMSEQIPLYRLQCNMNPAACIVAYKGMNSHERGSTDG